MDIHLAFPHKPICVYAYSSILGLIPSRSVTVVCLTKLLTTTLFQFSFAAHRRTVGMAQKAFLSGVRFRVKFSSNEKSKIFYPAFAIMNSFHFLRCGARNLLLVVAGWFVAQCTTSTLGEEPNPCPPCWERRMLFQAFAGTRDICERLLCPRCQVPLGTSSCLRPSGCGYCVFE